MGDAGRQRYGCPAMGDVVEGRKSTVESVEVEEHRGVRWDAGVERKMSRGDAWPFFSAFPMKDNILCLCDLPHVRPFHAGSKSGDGSNGL